MKKDTSSKAERIQIEIFRRVKPERKLELSFELSAFLRELIKEGVRNRHPEYSEEEVEFAVQKILLGEELFKRVYPHFKDILP
jgi:hypothetical protein